VWDFETDPEYQRKLDWADEFVREQVEPIDLVFGDPADKSDAAAMAVVVPLMDRVKEQGLFACHLGPELGGPGFGQLKLALLNEILGRSRWAPTVFGCAPPDSGNAEILAHFGTPEQKERYLQPLLDGRISSSYSMTEPGSGSDPELFTTSAVRDGDHWVINGEKWFTSNAAHASFFIVMVKTDPEAGRAQGMSMFLLPADTPGITVVRNLELAGEPAGHHTHGYVRYQDVRATDADILGGEGQAFHVAQTRLGGGRVHQAMRAVAQMRRAFDMMCERAVSRPTRTGVLGDLQMTQERIADMWVEIEQFRLLLLRTAWLIDKHRDYRKVRKDIAAVKVAMSRIYSDIVQRAMHLHGGLGLTTEMPFVEMWSEAEVMSVGDGVIEVHKVGLAKQVLRGYSAADPVLPSAHLPTRRAAALARFGLTEQTRSAQEHHVDPH
jgi:acyl-CoA dehydrogenase